MSWSLVLVGSAEKQLRKAPSRDRERIVAALLAMREDPFSGDIAYLKGEEAALRRRVGDWRIFFDVYPGSTTSPCSPSGGEPRPRTASHPPL